MRLRNTRRKSRRRGMFGDAGFGFLFATALLLQTSVAAAKGTVNVLYAGSLVNVMEHGIGPAFDKATGDTFQGFAGGSGLLANQIKGRLRQADVFISAVPSVNAGLMGSENGNWVSWYITFAQSPLVLGYISSSKFAADFKTKPWYQVLGEAGIRIGRTDPKLDPKGKLTLALMEAAAKYYKDPGLSQRVLGAPENPDQVLPEETLVGRLQSGQLDVGFFYSTETSDAKIPAITLPVVLAPKAVYTVTIVRDAPDASAADRFITFLLGTAGGNLMQQHGMTLTAPAINGDANKAPADIRSLVAK